jgi:hypothetical protein
MGKTLYNGEGIRIDRRDGPDPAIEYYSIQVTSALQTVLVNPKSWIDDKFLGEKICGWSWNKKGNYAPADTPC